MNYKNSDSVNTKEHYWLSNSRIQSYICWVYLTMTFNTLAPPWEGTLLEGVGIAKPLGRQGGAGEHATCMKDILTMFTRPAATDDHGKLLWMDRFFLILWKAPLGTEWKTGTLLQLHYNTN